MQANMQIKIAMSKDKFRILIKILAESHMAFNKWKANMTFKQNQIYNMILASWTMGQT